MVPLWPRLDFASSGALSSKLRPFGGHLFNFVHTYLPQFIWQTSSSQVIHFNYMYIYIYNYYTLLTVPLKVEILPSVGTKIHEASP